MPLTDASIRNAKPSDKPLRLFDSGGLYLEVAPSGGKWWRLKYRFAGKEKRISLGEYPEVGLTDARAKRDDARKLLREQHIVPLSSQAIAILRDLQAMTGRSNYVFPGARTNGWPMSENTVNAGLRRLGYTRDDMTGHGFRSMASTILNEQGWHRDAIERQLAHAERNSVRAAYNYAEHLPERRRMMHAWADYLDKLKAGAEVIPIKKKA